jgi:hydroxymethylpyrimidine/phosphomethylpyrimidine kinase
VITKKYKYPAVLTIAGSDSGGGAGIQGDLKTFSALGCFGTSAITAITAQNTLGVSAIHSIPPEIVEKQIQAVLEDIKPSAIKIGMVHSAELAVAIASVLKDYPKIPIIFDPVMVATSGDKLIENGTIDTLKQVLFPLSALVTPNLDEAALLAEMEINNLEDMEAAAEKIIGFGCEAVLVKGGHLKGKQLFDIYLDKNGYKQVFLAEFVDTNNTHGTGCSLSSAIAAFTARKLDLIAAIAEAKIYIQHAIESAKDVKTGKGNGPLNHFFNPTKLIRYELE